MSTLKKCKVVMLPTKPIKQEDVTREGHFHEGLLLQKEKLYLEGTLAHLYILSDDEIKEGDWFYNPATKETLYASKDMLSWNSDTTQEHKGWKKIVATTDKALKIPKPQPNSLDMFCKLEETLPQPSEGFLNKFVEEYNKGNIITEVLVEYVETDQVVKRFEEDEGYDSSMTTLKVNPKDNTITIKKAKDSWTREEMDSHVIAFATWYSGMKEASVRRAYERFKKEIIT